MNRDAIDADMTHALAATGSKSRLFSALDWNNDNDQLFG